MKYFIVSIFTILFLTSCSSNNVNRIAPGYGDAFIAIKNAFIGYEDAEISPEVIYNIPYASAFIKIGKGPRALMILESKNAKDLTWVTADGVFIVTRNGRIIKTSGLINNLVNSLQPFNFDRYDVSSEKIFYYSYDEPVLNNLRVSSVFKIKGKESVELFDRSKNLVLVEEIIKNEYLGWQQINKYWIDDDMFVWKSEQYISPKLPKIVVEVTKKPS